jgi:hypothetical protein
MKSLRQFGIVTRGLDLRVHLLRRMDCRVKPGNDEEGAV